jgi:hypothetical protein
MNLHATGSCPDLDAADDEQDPALLCHQALAQALRLAYERNRQAERYYQRGAVRAARHETAQLARCLGAAQQQLQALRTSLERCVS